MIAALQSPCFPTRAHAAPRPAPRRRGRADRPRPSRASRCTLIPRAVHPIWNRNASPASVSGLFSFGVPSRQASAAVGWAATRSRQPKRRRRARSAVGGAPEAERPRRRPSVQRCALAAAAAAAAAGGPAGAARPSRGQWPDTHRRSRPYRPGAALVGVESPGAPRRRTVDGGSRRVRWTIGGAHMPIPHRCTGAAPVTALSRPNGVSLARAARPAVRAPAQRRLRSL
jgi:hypothetical protein